MLKKRIINFLSDGPNRLIGTIASRTKIIEVFKDKFGYADLTITPEEDRDNISIKFDKDVVELCFIYEVKPIEVIRRNYENNTSTKINTGRNNFKLIEIK